MDSSTKDNWLKIAGGVVVLATPWLIRQGIDPKALTSNLPMIVGALGAGAAWLIGREHRTRDQVKAAQAAPAQK